MYGSGQIAEGEAKQAGVLPHFIFPDCCCWRRTRKTMPHPQEARSVYRRRISCNRTRRSRAKTLRPRGELRRLRRGAPKQNAQPVRLGVSLYGCLTMTYFRTGTPYYHRRATVSRSCSRWEGVVPAGYGRQALTVVQSSTLAARYLHARGSRRLNVVGGRQGLGNS